MSVFIQRQPFLNDLSLAENKQRIAYNFSRAAPYYDKADRLQRRVAKRLMLCLPETAEYLLDVGCGTGKWTKALSDRYENAQVIGIDFAWGMLQKARRQQSDNIHWCAGDIESLPLVDNSVDLVFSSLAVQWCLHLEKVLAEAFRLLKPGGMFVFSTLAKGSLQEMQYLWHGIDSLAHTNDYLSFNEQAEVCKRSPFSIQQLRCRSEVLYYDTVMSLLREFKSLGANTVTHVEKKGLMTPGKLQRFMLAYEKLRNKQGVPCTYKVIYGVLTKPRTSRTACS